MVPVAWREKSKVRVSHAFATVVVASVSTDFAMSAASSSLRRTLMPVTAERVRMVMIVLPAEKTTRGTWLPASVATVVPA